MDPTALLAYIPTQYVPWVTAAIAVCAVASAALPAPTTTSGGYFVAYTIINKIAMNFWHGANLSAPSSTGIVGGPGAVSAPQIATASVPKP